MFANGNVERPLAGKLFSPEENQGDGSLGAWKNYGGAKTWPAPQGWDNDQQWHGPPDPVLDTVPIEEFRSERNRTMTWDHLLRQTSDWRGTLWDSGKVVSAEQLHVVYQGRPLESETRCHWRVRVWDGEDRPSPFSSPSRWEKYCSHHTTTKNRISSPDFIWIKD